MRDLDTIATAVTAAETGHLVLSTLHTIGAVPTIERIIDVFPMNQQAQIRLQLATLLEAIISQQLLPTADRKGRVAAFEIMYANSAVRNLIREAKSHQIPSIIPVSYTHLAVYKRQIVKRCRTRLKGYEEKLHLIEKFQLTKDKLGEIESIAKENFDEQTAGQITTLAEEIYELI